MRDDTITKAAAVVPSDTDDLTFPGIGLYVGVTGDVKITTLEDDTITMVGLVAGLWHPIHAKKVFSTDTTATSILVGW